MKWLRDIFKDNMSDEYRQEFLIRNVEVDIRVSRIMLVTLLILEGIFLLLTYFDGLICFYGTYLNGYRAMYCVVIVISVVLLTIIKIFSKKTDKNRADGLMFVGTVFVSFMLIWGAGISVMDISRGISSSVYLYVAFTISIFVFMNPIKSLIVYGSSLAIYYSLIIIFVNDPTIVFSSSINGVSFIITAWVISITQYQSRKRQFLSDKIILEKNNQLSKMAEIDPLTNTFNRRSLDRLLEELGANSLISNEQISIMMIDIDYFKEINDCYGHICGDEVLVKISDIIKKAVRPIGGQVCRYGGDEFCILFLGIKEDELKNLSRQIKESVIGLDIENKDSITDQVLTVSIGCSKSQPNTHDNLWGLIKQADDDLYLEKSKRLHRRKDDMQLTDDNKSV